MKSGGFDPLFKLGIVFVVGQSVGKSPSTESLEGRMSQAKPSSPMKPCADVADFI